MQESSRASTRWYSPHRGTEDAPDALVLQAPNDEPGDRGLASCSHVFALMSPPGKLPAPSNLNFWLSLAFTSRCKAKKQGALESSRNVDRGYRGPKVVSEDHGTRPCENIGRGPRRGMIDSLLNLLFRCSHRRLTRPVTPITKPGHPYSQSYVVCLDCGKQFEYNLSQMTIGKAIDHSHEAGAEPPDMPAPRKTKVG
jgi:hypothetical protein